jgi:Recombinase
MSAAIVTTPRPGRPPACPRETVMRTITLRDQGMSYQKIADTFNAEGVQTPEGSLWLKSSVDRLLHTQHAEAIRREMEVGRASR